MIAQINEIAEIPEITEVPANSTVAKVAETARFGGKLKIAEIAKVAPDCQKEQHCLVAMFAEIV